MGSRSRAVPDEELFMSRPAPDDDCDSPTIEPLRIFKPASPKPAQGGDSRSRFKYPAPPSSSSSSAAAAAPSKATLPPLPSFPLPPEPATSSSSSTAASCLSYPEEHFQRPSQPAKVTTRLPYPDDDNRSSSSSGSSRPQRGSPGPSGGYNDTSPRLNMSPIEKKAGLAERRGTAPKPLSPTSADEDGDELFAKPLRDPNQGAPTKISTAYQHKPYYPPPGGARNDSSSSLKPQPQVQDSSVNRFASTASNSTTRANRGSPPPPETPVFDPGSLPALPVPGGGIEARYAASGISGTATLTTLQAQQAQSAAAQSRLAQYGRQPPASSSQSQAPRPWTPTETPDQTPHGPVIAYQGSDPVPVTSPPPQQTSFNLPQNPNPSKHPAQAGPELQVSVLEQDFQRMQAATPPPAYDSVEPQRASQPYRDEKTRPQQAAAGPSSSAAATTSEAQIQNQTTAAPAVNGGRSSAGPSTQPAASPPRPSASVQKPNPVAAGLASPAPHNAGHPALVNEPVKQEAFTNGQGLTHTPSLLASATSPPPLPEGWIAHLDQNSGQYYYIHLATQATQWEFPKGPNPINHEAAPLSPAASTYGNPLGSPFGKQSLGSPMFAPQTPGYAESIMSVAASTTPSMAGFSGPPPSAGVDMYRITPTNSVYFGPYLRYANMDLEKGLWLGSIMIVTDAPQPPTIHIHLSVDLSPNPRQLVPRPIFTHQRWVFYKYDMDLQMSEHGTERWTYAVTSHLGCTRYEFVVAGRYETGWRMVAHSNNDFAPATSQNDRAKLGGVGFMWKDVLQKNVECGGFHVQLGLGGQVYGDRLWREVPLLRQWLAMQGRENRKNTQWTARHEEDVSHAYFHYYTSHFDQPFLREAFAQIPHVLQLDDHDIFDGYGSYPDYMQASHVFKNIGRLAIEMYLLFQHHTTMEVLRNVGADSDLFTITGQGWHFLKYLGPAVVVVGPDCRSERTKSRVMAGPTYQGIFPKVAMLPPSVQHCLWLVGVPVVYPRLDTVETLAQTFTTGKKVINTSYNVLGKVTSSVAGVVGGKEVVQQGFNSVKKAVGKGGLMGGVLNQFGDVDIGEDLKDLWTHESKDLERTYLIRTLQGIAQQKGIRMTFLSGDVNACGAGLVHDPTHPSDHKTMYQIISSPVVAAPAGTYLLKLLHNNKLLYVPANGHKSTHEVSDTKEDMMEIFHTDASGVPREHKKLMGRRNYVAIVAYDPEVIAGTQYAASVQSGSAGGGGLSKLSLAVDFVVQGDSGFTAPTKYGPVIVPHLEFGH